VRRAGERLTLKRLLTAIDDDELCLDFQAVVSRNPRQVKRLEALVRWQHPVLGRLPPAEFLPLAESDEAAMNALTDWVVDGTVEAYQVLAELGFSVPLSVNMSMLNLHDSTLPDRLEQRLRQGSMPTRHLHIEVSVSDSFADTSRVSSVLARLRLKGMAMAISGFGSGNASLKLLRQLPFSEVKLDRSFVRDIASSRESQVIVKSVVALCNSLSVDCVAEGVETAASANMLEALGVSQLQGEFIARPMPVEAVSAWIAGFADEPQPSPDNRRVFTGASTGPPPAMASAPETVPGAPRVRLPPRQEQVMQLVAEGCSVKEIARRLGLGPGTVKVHLSLAYSTLGAHNRIEALRNFGALRDPVAHGGNKMDDQGFAQEALSA
jgi:EAL domain-containing protein (putative c-di-GMP-specific phosphodiesterase class I)/DNA-binding CsgD family transcriptional regulator